MSTHRFVSLALVFLFAVFGCAGGDVLGSDDSEVPNVTGTYDGTAFVFGSEAGGGDAGTSGDCDVVIDLASQSGTEVSGSFQLGSQCSSRSGEVKGTVCEEDPQGFGCSEDQAAIRLDLSSGGNNVIESVTGCSITSGDGSFAGFVLAEAAIGALQVSANQVVTACPDDNGGTATVEWSFDIQADKTS